MSTVCKSFLIPKINERIAAINSELSDIAIFQDKLDVVVSSRKLSVRDGFSRGMLSASEKAAVVTCRQIYLGDSETGHVCHSQTVSPTSKNTS